MARDGEQSIFCNSTFCLDLVGVLFSYNRQRMPAYLSPLQLVSCRVAAVKRLPVQNRGFK